MHLVTSILMYMYTTSISFAYIPEVFMVIIMNIHTREFLKWIGRHLNSLCSKNVLTLLSNSHEIAY